MRRFLVPLAAFAVAAVLVGGDYAPLLSPGYLVEAHQDIAADCDACHLPFRGIPDGRCLACHEEIGTLRTRRRGYHGAHADRPCVACHADHVGTDARAVREAALAAFDHDLTAFRLHGRHARIACAACHDRPFVALRQGCGACHEDGHAGLLGSNCAPCHSEQGWTRPRRTLAAHDLPMDGGHAGLDCVDCHAFGEALDASVGCAFCHERGHGGTTADCSACHDVGGWRPASFDHGPCGCAFPGKHQTAPCLACHTDFVFVGTPARCEACHRADLAHDDLGPCARCHTASAWTDRIFDHDDTAFRLDGAHLSVSCSQCHPDGVFGEADPACGSCHGGDEADAHPPMGACDRCHTTGAFAPSTFDHAETGFPLTGRHAEAGCWSCHPDRVEGYTPEISPDGG